MIAKILSRLKSGFINDVMITTLGQVVIMIFSFILNKVLSSMLTVEDFGIYNLIRRASGVITYMMLVAMGIAVPKYLAEYKEKEDEKKLSCFVIVSLGIVLFFSIICCVVIYACKDFFSRLLFDSDAYWIYIFPMLCFSFASALATYSYSYFRGVGDYRKYNSFQIVVQFLMVVMAIAVGKNVYMVYLFCAVSIIVFLLVFF